MLIIANYIYLVLHLIHTSDCSIEAKIVGGVYSNIFEFPHSAFLAITPEELSGRHLYWICGSSIVNQKLLLTAAHCLDDCSPKCWVSVSTGHTKVEKGRASSISRYVIHENYTSYTSSNDIALVQLKSALTYGMAVKRIVLMKNPPYEEMAHVAGWGIVDLFIVVYPLVHQQLPLFPADMSPSKGCLEEIAISDKEDKEIAGDKLKSLVQYIHKKEECRDLLNSTIPLGTFCASSGSVDDYASGGDSGNALVVRGYIQIGLVSYKKPYTNRHVVVYTDTGYFYDWIATNTRKLICRKKG